MFCPNCGKELPNDAAFCEKCGAAQHSVPKKNKTAKVGLIVCLILVLAVLAVGAAYLLIPRTETVYVLKSYTMINPDGSQQEFKYRFDEYGNPTRLFSMVLYQQLEAEYDDQGNLTELTKYSISDADKKYGRPSEYKYSYDDDGRIESCKEYYNDQKVAAWDFTWDKRGNLTQVILDGKPDGNKIVRQDWEYDKKGQLVTEYVCLAFVSSPVEDAAQYLVFRCEYVYNDDGNLSSYEYVRAEDLVEDFEDMDYTDLDYKDEIYFSFTYNEDGKIAAVETNYSGEVSENEFDYDSDGNLDCWDDYEYDEHGNLLWTGSSNVYEYEAVEMSPEAAQRYHRWESLYSLNPCLRYYHPLMSFAGQEDMFYYYLIPNPVW